MSIGVGGGRPGRVGAPKNGKTSFGSYHEKFWHFAGKRHVKFRNFVNFSGKYHKNSDSLIILRANIT